MPRVGAHHPGAIWLRKTWFGGSHDGNCMVPMGMSREIDVMHLGRDRVICAHELDGLIVDPGPTSCLDTLLEALGEQEPRALGEGEPRALLLTHIHLDHAGASGSLVRRFPDLRVYVHESGARHLVDPAKLLESATRLYGDDMDRLWGEVLPVSRESIVALEGGESPPRSTRWRTRTWRGATARRPRRSSCGWASSATGESAPAAQADWARRPTAHRPTGYPAQTSNGISSTQNSDHGARTRGAWR